MGVQGGISPKSPLASRPLPHDRIPPHRIPRREPITLPPQDKGFGGAGGLFPQKAPPAAYPFQRVTRKPEKEANKIEMMLANETMTAVNDGIRLIQNPEGLTFGTDALLLAAFVRRAPAASAAEFGSGSGIVSLLLAARGKVGRILAVEVQEYYADLTKRNAELNGMAHRIEARCADIREMKEQFDVIYSNPPYMRTAGQRNRDEGKYAARHEVNGGLRDFCFSAARNLKYGGRFYCVCRPDRAVDLIAAMREAAVEPKRMVFVSPTAAHPPCLMLVEGKRGGKPSCRVLPTLFLQREDGRPTEEAEQMGRTGDWPDRE